MPPPEAAAPEPSAAEPSADAEPEPDGVEPGSPQPEAEAEAKAEAGSADEAAPAPDPQAERVEQLDLRRRNVVALTRGELDPTVDVDDLLSIQLTGDALLDADDLRALSEALATPPPEPPPAPEPKPRSRSRSRSKPQPPPAPEPDPDSTSLADAKARLIGALVEWSRLDPAERGTRLKAHREAVELRATRQAKLQAQLEQARRDKTRLDAFVAGTLDPAIDPRPLLRIDLADGATGVAPAGTEALQRDLERAQQDLAEVRHALLKRPAAERQALLAAHQARAAPPPEPEPEPELEPTEPEAEVAEAEQAAVAVAREKEQALAKARDARTDALRRLAEEHARLLGVKEDQARFEVALAERRAAAAAQREAVAAWQLRVTDIIDAVEAFAAPAEDPDGLYPLIREELGGTRSRLGEVLGQLVGRDSEVPVPGQLVELDAEADPTEIRQLHRELVATSERLGQEERALRWTLAEGYRTDLVELNAARLQLLETTSPELRSAVTGFGPAGVGQVSEEASQIGLDLRYRGLSLPHHLLRLANDLRTAPIPLLLGLLQLVVVALVFRWWRRRAPSILEAAQRPAPAPPGPRRARRRSAGWMAGVAWYLTRIRKPLEWLALAAVIYYGSSATEAFPELELLWLVVLWLLLGSTTILLVDAIAARESRRQGGPSATAEVRIRSLRVIGRSVTYTGLVLSLADALVGKGAIYAWVLRTCWLLAIPIALLLTHWWRGEVFAAFTKEPEGRLSTWVRARTTGWASYPAAMLGGLFLVARGSWRWLVRRAARFEGTRHLLAYLFRRQVARQAEVTGLNEKVEPAEDALRERFVAPLAPPQLLQDVVVDELQRLQNAAARPGSTFSVVVGERGLGKSTLLGRLRDAHDGPTLALNCPASGLPGLVAAMARVLGLSEGADLEQVAKALADGGPRLVTLDDIQRLVQPTIGGMQGLDELGLLARRAGANVSWVATIGSAAWQYVSRARGDRLHFDEVLRLQPWNEASICALMERRCKDLDVEPSFDGLVIPRQYDDDELEQDRRSEIGYYRILWDYAGGNPHVATWFWAQSLFREPGGRLVVRVFREPPATELDALPLTLQFVLRALVQLETATKPEVAAAIRMPLAEAEDALRFALGRGYVDEDGGVFAITWPWYRAITRMLQRQHLLAA